MKQPKRVRRSHEQWQEIVEQYQSSELSARSSVPNMVLATPVSRSGDIGCRTQLSKVVHDRHS